MSAKRDTTHEMHANENEKKGNAITRKRIRAL